MLESSTVFHTCSLVKHIRILTVSGPVQRPRKAKTTSSPKCPALTENLAMHNALPHLFLSYFRMLFIVETHTQNKVNTVISLLEFMVHYNETGRISPSILVHIHRKES